MAKKEKILEYIDDHNILGANKKATPVELEAAIRRQNIRDKELEKRYFTEKPKPKTNGEYKMPKVLLDSFDWDMWLRKHDPSYETLEEEMKKSSAESFIKKYQEFLKNKKQEDRTIEGLASLLGVDPGGTKK